jgi:uncharacterized protein (DUF1778 family)
MPRAIVETNPRFTMDIPPPDKARLMRAAALERTSLKDFLLRNALQAAETVLNKAEHIAVSERDTQVVLGLLDAPPEANPRMVRALEGMAASRVET